MGYYIANGNEKIGPLTEKQIVNAVKRGQLSMFSMVLNEQIAEWVMLMQHPDFSDIQLNDVEVNTEAPGEDTMVLPFDESSVDEATQLTMEDTPELTPVFWYLQDQPQALGFLDILVLLKNKSATEHTLISKNPAGPWEPVIAWSEFSPEFRSQYGKVSKTQLPDVQLRRKFPRHVCGQNFIFQVGESLFKAFCLETSEEGMSIVIKTKRCAVRDTIRIKFSDTLKSYNFDAKGVVIAEKKVKMPGSEELLNRFSIRFTHFTVDGKAFIASQIQSR